jgi:molecular chaperone DnaJ
MAGADYYDLLGVAKGADPKDIKSAYRKMAMKFHPDQNPGDKAAEDKFKEINEAYAVLSDPEKRARYDRFGKAAFEQGGGPGGGFGGGDPSDIFNSVFGDVFGEMFGGGGGRRTGPQRGADLRYDLELSLEEAFAGKSTRVTVPVLLTCEVCTGSGAAAGSKPQTCGTCGGNGVVRTTQGFFQMQRTCPTCGGQGQVIKDHCKSCGGRGVKRSERTLDITIPEGVEDGTRIRLAGEGEAGPRGGPRGDLYVFLSVESHELFERDGADLFCRAPVPMTTAALGGEIEMPTIDGGRAKVKIPEGSQGGRRFRLNGKGMTRLRNKVRGDMYVEIHVETPRNLTERQKKLLQEFSDCCDGKAHPESTGFFDKVKRFFDGADAPKA